MKATPRPGPRPRSRPNEPRPEKEKPVYYRKLEPRDIRVEGSQRARFVDPVTCDRDYSPDELEFMEALEGYKRRKIRPFPTCCEVLAVLKSLGYAKPKAAG